jgi:hypothetical protein
VLTGVVEFIHSPGVILELIRLFALLLGQKAIFSCLPGFQGSTLYTRKKVLLPCGVPLPSGLENYEK